MVNSVVDLVSSCHIGCIFKACTLFDSLNCGMVRLSSARDQRFIFALVFIPLLSVNTGLSFAQREVPNVPRINYFGINSAVEQVRRRIVIIHLHLFCSIHFII
jgi:hypothetical protein